MLNSARLSNLISVTTIGEALDTFSEQIKGHIELSEHNFLFLMHDESIFLVNTDSCIISPFESLVDLAITWRLNGEKVQKDFPGLNLDKFLR